MAHEYNVKTGKVTITEDVEVAQLPQTPPIDRVAVLEKALKDKGVIDSADIIAAKLDMESEEVIQ